MSIRFCWIYSPILSSPPPKKKVHVVSSWDGVADQMLPAHIKMWWSPWIPILLYALWHQGQLLQASRIGKVEQHVLIRVPGAGSLFKCVVARFCVLISCQAWSWIHNFCGRREEQMFWLFLLMWTTLIACGVRTDILLFRHKTESRSHLLSSWKCYRKQHRLSLLNFLCFQVISQLMDVVERESGTIRASLYTADYDSQLF